MELNETRQRVGLAGAQRAPQWSQPAAVPGRNAAAARVSAALARARPGRRAADLGGAGRGGEPPPGRDPLVLVAPSTAQDPDHRLLRAALLGLADEPVQRARQPPTVAAAPGPSQSRPTRGSSTGSPMPRRCRRRRWSICHAGHGTLARALTLGRPVLAVPHVGDMPENAARLAWSGAGVRLPWPLLSPRRCATGSPRAGPTGTWRCAPRSWRPGRAARRPARAADLVERLARGQPDESRPGVRRYTRMRAKSRIQRHWPTGITCRRSTRSAVGTRRAGAARRDGGSRTGRRRRRPACSSGRAQAMICCEPWTTSPSSVASAGTQ